MLVAFSIVIFIFLIIHYNDRVIRWCKRKIHPVPKKHPNDILVINFVEEIVKD